MLPQHLQFQASDKISDTDLTILLEHETFQLLEIKHNRFTNSRNHATLKTLDFGPEWILMLVNARAAASAILFSKHVRPTIRGAVKPRGNRDPELGFSF